MNTIAIIITALSSLIITAVIGIWLIPFLKKVKYGQTINEIGPRWHKAKQGIPTMGGFMFIIGIIIASVIGYFIISKDYASPEGYRGDTIKFFAGLFMAAAYGFLGYIDDYIKVVKKRNLGLTERQKLIMQIIIAIVYLVTLYTAGATSTDLYIPFIGTFDIGVFYYPLALFFVVGFVNAVNITDGIDGLASSITFVTAVAFMIATTILKFAHMNILATALAGACIGFLIWNFYPAKVFMGDTGSMFLGGMVVAIAFGMDMPVILVLFGIIYVLDTLSVILQVISVKLTGKRIFKMSPIHHHFEMSGYSEVKIVALFSFVAVIGCVLGIIAIILM